MRITMRFIDVAGVALPASQRDGRSVIACDLFREGGAAILVRHRRVST